jgi:hypothetical protein
MISTRFLPALCVIVGLTLIPTLIHSYSDSTVHDGRSTAIIPETLAGYIGRPSDRNATWGQRRFRSDDWTERIYRNASDEVKLSVIRSYDAKALYHHPELAVSYGPSYTTTEVRRFPVRPDVPVHVLHTDSATLAMYALLYDERFVDDPIRFQLRTAGELLVSGRKPMTLFFLTDERASADVEALPSIGLFFEAINHFAGTK